MQSSSVSAQGVLGGDSDVLYLPLQSPCEYIHFAFTVLIHEFWSLNLT